MATLYPPLTEGVIQGLAKIMGDTTDGLTGTDISRYLQQTQIEDYSPNITKWKRLFNAFVYYQIENRCCNAILNFCKLYFQPTRFVNCNKFLYESQRAEANRLLGFCGFGISERGGITKCSQVRTIPEAEERANSLKLELQARNTHQQIFRFCTPEFLSDDYFHAIDEAIKGLFERVRELSASYLTDGVVLIDSVFSKDKSKLLINNFQTESEISEHKGFASMLKAIYSMFRNPEAHSTRKKWPMDKVDALDILGIISLCHRKLDKAHRIR